MKFKFLVSALLLGGSLSCFAQGYKDGIEYYKVGQYENAKELLERNLSAAGTVKSQSFYYLGKIAMKAGNNAEAKSYFEKGIAADANDAYNYVGLGCLDLKAGLPKQAEADFKMALSKVKKDAKLQTEIARAYYEANPTTYEKDIKKNIEKARKIKATDPDSYIFEGDMYAALEKNGDAAGQYELAFGYDPQNAEAYVKYATTYASVVPDVSIERLKEYVDRNPQSALAQRELAELYYRLDFGKLAAEQYGVYIKNPNHFVQDEVRYVALLFFGQNYEQSLALATSLVNKSTTSAKDKFYMTRMQLYNLVAMEKWKEAEAKGAELMAMNVPGTKFEAKDFTDYAAALKANGKAAEAVAQYEKAVELNPNKTDLIRDLVDTYEDAENFEKAAYYYQKIVDGPDCKANDIYMMSTKYFNVAVTTKDEATKENAVKLARKYAAEANEKVPDNYRIVQQMAKVEMFDNKIDAATKYYKEMIAILDAKDNRSEYASTYRSAYQSLALMNFKAGNKEAAKTYYKKWLEYDPDNAELRKYVEGLE